MEPQGVLLISAGVLAVISAVMWIAGGIGLFIVGMAIAFCGTGLFIYSASAFHEAVIAILFTGGMILSGLGMILHEIKAARANSPERRRAEAPPEKWREWKSKEPAAARRTEKAPPEGDSWGAIAHDPDIASAVDELQPFGDDAVKAFQAAYLIVNDKTKITALVGAVKKRHAEAPADEPYAFRKI